MKDFTNPDRCIGLNSKALLGIESAPAQWAIREVKAFLFPFHKQIHSLILVGSYALGHARKDSDVDFLMLIKGAERARRLSRILFDWSLALHGDREHGQPAKLQVVDLDERHAEHLFEMCSPLVHAAAQGIVIHDDGYFRTLLSRPYPKWPTKEGSVEALSRWIVWQYYHSAIDLKREILSDHAPDGLCTRNGKCFGHASGDLLARVISRMLYVTLPSRGFLPRTKLEARAMALTTYGRKVWRPLMLASSILRNERSITDKEFRLLFPLARDLYRECLGICGPRNP